MCKFRGKRIDFSRKFSTRRYIYHSEMLGAFKHEVMSIIERYFFFITPSNTTIIITTRFNLELQYSMSNKTNK